VSTPSVSETLKECRVQSGIKWATHILSDGRKIAHCFCEVVPSPLEGFCSLLIGVDVNVDVPEEEMACNPYNMTSMVSMIGMEVNKEQLLHSLSNNLRRSVFRLLDGDVASSFPNKINASLLYKGSTVEVEIAPSSV